MHERDATVLNVYVCALPTQVWARSVPAVGDEIAQMEKYV
jgi:hypothetical protein